MEVTALRILRGRIRQAGPRVFEEVLTENLDALYRTSLRLCDGNRADAEDLLQDSVLRAFQHFHELRDPAAARAWMFTILTRTNLNRRRSSRRRAELFSGDLEEREFENALASWKSAETPEDVLEVTMTQQQLTAVLAGMEEELRTVIWLSDAEGFRQREVAAMLGIPEGTVASRLFRARRAVRESFRSDEPASAARGGA